jgi:ATP-dependent RNA helicase DeaD
MNKFDEFDLSEDIKQAIDKLGFETPTEVQRQVIPKFLNGKDIIVKSQTGSGKTASFAIPICELVDWQENKPQAIVLTPTRELALQVKEDVFNIGRIKRIKVVSVFGKSPMKAQTRDLKQKTHVVVGTPGRLLDHLENSTIDVSKVKYLIIDEADEMLNMGFIKQLELILKYLPKKRISVLLSATMPSEIEKLAKKYLLNPESIVVESENSTIDRIAQEKYLVDYDEKLELLYEVTKVENPDSCILFCNTKQRVDEVEDFLHGHSYTVGKIHGGMMQDDRTKIMKAFKLGEFRYLVATDVASRGIDVDNITLVINFDIPQDKESYIHRIGRTGRKENSGKAISFVAYNEERYINEIENFIDLTLTLKKRPSKAELEKSSIAFEQKMEKLADIKEEKGASLNKEILKLHINAGKKQKMRHVDIVGTICNLEGMSAEDVGIISIIDISTFVEILNNKGERVLEMLKSTPIKGRLRNVNISRT